MVDSSRNAYLPLEFCTRATPSSVLLTNTLGFAVDMNFHISLYTLCSDFCSHIRTANQSAALFELLNHIEALRVLANQSAVYCKNKPISVRTAKKLLVEPASRVPYCISFCLTSSSAELMGVYMRSMVRKAARLAV
jgi:hypothetical protein